MIWQDMAIAGANVVFSLALIPQVFYGFKRKRGLMTIATSLPSFMGLYVMSIAFFTLSLHFAAVFSFINATFWLTFFIQRLVYKKA